MLDFVRVSNDGQNAEIYLQSVQVVKHLALILILADQRRYLFERDRLIYELIP